MISKEKIQKQLPEFVKEVDGLSVQELETRLSNLAKAYEETEQAKENDEEYQHLKAAVSVAGAPYRDAKKAVRMKSSYIVSLIKEKGGE